MTDQYKRQSFLGNTAQDIFAGTRVGIIGLGGGGSHVGQQLAHIGFQNFRIFDPQEIERPNLNRLVGGRDVDVNRSMRKVDIAARLIKGIQPKATVEKIYGRWQDDPEKFRTCDLVVACVDGYAARAEIEQSARRYLMPVIDIGMDVREYDKGKFDISGQVILSIPGFACMRCMGFLTPVKLAEEAGRYGDVGDNPQVVWSNGVLASTAVGIAVDLLTAWTLADLPQLYLTYDGTQGIVKEHPVLRFLPPVCTHFPRSFDAMGDPVFETL